MVVLFADQRCRLWQVLTPLVIVIITPEIIKILPFLSSSLVLARLYPKTNLEKTELSRPKSYYKTERKEKNDEVPLYFLAGIDHHGH